jgi:hypothetical protein
VTPSPDRAEQRRFLRDLALLLGVPGLVVGAMVMWTKPWRLIAEPYTAPAGDVFAVAAGTWDWAGADGFCQKDPHTITFSPDRALMTLTPRQPWTDSTGTVHERFEYDVQEYTAGHIRGRIRGETRMTEQGEPVVWDLVLVGPNTYRWHRTDWPLGMLTNPVHRCPVSTTAR